MEGFGYVPDITTKQLVGKRVVDEKGKKVGKVYRFVFHPTEKRLIGFTVKRPDAALMFHRKDLFVTLGGYFENGEGELVLADAANATPKAACKSLGVSWDSCVLWVGMPVQTESGEMLGYVDEVTFDASTGAVRSLSTENGAAKKALLGSRIVAARHVKGFRLNDKAADPADRASADDGYREEPAGAILVSDAALEDDLQGGAAAAAGRATAVVSAKAKKRVVKVKAAADEAAVRVKPTAQKAAASAGEAVNKGAFVAGRQLGRASGMFSAFKEEFEKASRESREES